MVQAFDDTRPRQLRRPAPAEPGRVPPHDLEAEESLLGAMLLSNDAVVGGASRTARPATSTSRRTGTSSAPSRPLIERGEADRRRHGHRRAPALGVARGRRRPVRSSFRCRPTRRRSPTPATTPRSSRSTRCCAGSSAWPARSPTSRYSVPEDVEGRRRRGRADDVQRGRAAARPTPCAAARAALARGWTASRSWASAARPSPAWPPATTSSTRSCSASSPQSLTIVGARPGMGKTSFALGILANVGRRRCSEPALLFSLEMGHLELTQRMLASEAEVERARTCRPGGSATQDWSQIGTAVTRLSSCAHLHRRQPQRHRHGHPGPGPAAQEVRGRPRARRDRLPAADDRPGSARRTARPRWPRSAAGSRSWPVSSRCPWSPSPSSPEDLESRQDKRPMLSDLRESGSLEQDADVVLFFTASPSTTTRSPIDRADDALIDVAKHRNGPTGKANMVFLASTRASTTWARASDDLTVAWRAPVGKRSRSRRGPAPRSPRCSAQAGSVVARRPTRQLTAARWGRTPPSDARRRAPCDRPPPARRLRQEAIPLVGDEAVEGSCHQRLDRRARPAVLEHGAKPLADLGWLVVEEAVRHLQASVVPGARRRVQGGCPTPPGAADAWDVDELGPRRLAALDEDVDAPGRPPGEDVCADLDPWSGDKPVEAVGSSLHQRQQVRVRPAACIALFSSTKPSIAPRSVKK